MIARHLRNKQARTEPIKIENFVTVAITYKNERLKKMTFRPFYATSFPGSLERRETLVGSGHVHASVTIENTREGSSLNKEFVALSFVEFKASLGIDKILTKPPLPSLVKLSSLRFWETRDQTLPGSLLARPRR